jgi:signal transduction histidine kinase
MGLRGYAELFRDTAGETERLFADKIIRLAKKSAYVIRNIEAIRRIYKNPPEVREVDLTSIIKKEMDSHPGIHIHLENRENCTRKVLANDMLGVVFDNLFSNSIKFGRKDADITISAKETLQGLLEISVSDTGPGISDAMKLLVFDRFMQDSR